MTLVELEFASMSDWTVVRALSAAALLVGCAPDLGFVEPDGGQGDPALTDDAGFLTVSRAVRRGRNQIHVHPGHPGHRDAGSPGRADAGSGETGTDAGTTDPADAGPVDPGPVDAGSDDPGPVDPGDGDPGDGIAMLGTLPDEMSGLRWPEAPVITRDVTVTNASDFAAAVRVAGTRVHVVGAVGGGATVSANDVEILADDATSLGHLTIGRGVSRVHISGGTWGGILLSIPAQFYPSVEYRSEWMASDVLIENVHVVSSDIAFEIRGRRIAILHSSTEAGRYSVWCGDTASMQSEDVILFENRFDSAGPEATVRMVSALRSATIGNTLINTFKHNYRIHGVSDLNYARGNLLINTGVMLGRMEGDVLGREWFDGNEFHHTAPDLFNPDHAISTLHATDNVVYTDVWSCFYCGSAPSSWTVSDNFVHPYTPAPAY